MTRRLLPALALPLVIGTGASLLHACSNTVPGTGIELVIDSTLTSDQFDSVSLEVQQAAANGSFGTALIKGGFPVPDPYKLPATFAIQAGTSANEIVLINVSATKNGTPVVVRQIQVQVPSDRLAELTVLLAETCYNQICAPTQNLSCQPATGTCAQTTLTPSQSLSSFNVEAGAKFYVDASGGASGSGSGSGSNSGSGSGSNSGSGSSSGTGSGSAAQSGSGRGSDGGLPPPLDAGHGSGHDAGPSDSGTSHDSGIVLDSGRDGSDAGCTEMRSCVTWCCPFETTCGTQADTCCMGTCFNVGP